MTKIEPIDNNVSIKCPNPKCGLILNSPYHTVCPRCAEPFPISMLHVEKPTSRISTFIIVIALIAVFIAFVAFLLFLTN